MPRYMNATELKRSGLLERVADELVQFTVGFVKLVDRSGMEDMIYAGSGTLVKTQQNYGILTADHVLQNQARGRIGLVFPNRTGGNPQRYFFQIDEAQKLRIGPASNTPDGPDLGLLLLHSSDACHIETRNAFYNLSKRQGQMETPRDVAAGGWFLSGAADEWTTEGPPERAFTKLKIFKGFCGAGVVQTERITPTFDYLDFEVAVNEAYEGPMDFGGVSGGGLWQIVIEDYQGELRIAERLLSGVAFWQGVVDGKPQRVICHGRRSIYDSVINALA